MSTRVLVFGATGTMGKRVVSMLRETLAIDRVVRIARQSGDIRVDINRPGSLRLTRGDVVIDAVGPYRHDPRAIVGHCLRNAAHYVDLSESAEFHQLALSALQAHEQDQPAASAVVQGCSTVPAMVDILMPHEPGCTRTALLSVGIQNEASAALLFGLLRPLGRTHRCGRWWHETVTRELLDGHTRRYGSHPSPFADSATNFYCGLDRRSAYWLLRCAAPFTSRLSDNSLERLCRAVAPIAPLVAWAGTPQGSLRIEQHCGEQHCGEQHCGEQLERFIELRAAKHGLMIPALPAVWAALALLEHDDHVGITPLSLLIQQSQVITNLRARSYSVDQRCGLVD